MKPRQPLRPGASLILPAHHIVVTPDESAKQWRKSRTPGRVRSGPGNVTTSLTVAFPRPDKPESEP